MKKYLPYIIAAVVLLGGAGAYLALSGNKNTDKQTAESQKSTSENKDNGKIAKKYTDACKLLTPDEIGTALGGTFGNGEEDIATNAGTPGTPHYEELEGSACRFEQKNDGSTDGMKNSVSLSIAINNYETAAKATTWMDELHTPPTAEGREAVDKPVDVKGVGDQAFFAQVKDGGTGMSDKTTALYVRVKNQVVVLTATKLTGIDQSAMQASLTELAKKL